MELGKVSGFLMTGQILKYGLDTVGIARLQMEIIFFLKQIMRLLVCSVQAVICVMKYM